MSDFMKRSARHFLAIKAARQLRQEIEKAKVDNLKVLADAGVSIVETYLNGCSPQDRTRIRQDLSTLLQMGVTLDMVLDEVALQMPEIAPIIKNKVAYRKGEIEKLMSFAKEG